MIANEFSIQPAQASAMLYDNELNLRDFFIVTFYGRSRTLWAEKVSGEWPWWAFANDLLLVFSAKARVSTALRALQVSVAGLPADCVAYLGDNTRQKP